MSKDVCFGKDVCFVGSGCRFLIIQVDMYTVRSVAKMERKERGNIRKGDEWEMRQKEKWVDGHYYQCKCSGCKGVKVALDKQVRQETAKAIFDELDFFIDNNITFTDMEEDYMKLRKKWVDKH